MKISAICTDIDGTLLDSRRELSPKTIEVFRKIPSTMPIILASSRMPSAMVHLQEELQISDHPLIAYNGGYALHFSNNDQPKIFSSIGIPVSVCASILTLTHGTSIHVSLYTEDLWFAPALDYWTDREQRITKVNAQVGNILSVIQQWQEKKKTAHKVMCMGLEAEINTLELQLRESLSDEIHIYRSRPTYLELAPKSVSKATALRLILKDHFNIEMNEVMAFGDNYNDIDLLHSVGLGIAVENARDEVKAVAKEITSKSIDDGVALAIERYIL